MTEVHDGIPWLALEFLSAFFVVGLCGVAIVAYGVVIGTVRLASWAWTAGRQFMTRKARYGPSPFRRTH